MQKTRFKSVFLGGYCPTALRSGGENGEFTGGICREGVVRRGRAHGKNSPCAKQPGRGESKRKLPSCVYKG